MAYDRYFGFDLIQRRTLAKLLAEVVGADPAALAALEQRVADLEDAVEALEGAA